MPNENTTDWIMILTWCGAVVVPITAIFRPANDIIQSLLRRVVHRMMKPVETDGRKPVETDRAKAAVRADECFKRIIRAGPQTGIIERIIVFVLVLHGEFTAMAWVMAAKGFIIQAIVKTPTPSDKTSDEEAIIQKEAYLLGTFASFAIAIVGALIFKKLLFALNAQWVFLDSEI